MILKINNQALEQEILAREVFEARNFFLRKKNIALHKGLMIPDDLIAEIEEFTERNSLAITKGVDKIAHKCCDRCLKAHILRKAEEFGLDQDSVNFLDSLIKVETGHNGYYLDEDRLIKICK